MLYLIKQSQLNPFYEIAPLLQMTVRLEPTDRRGILENLFTRQDNYFSFRSLLTIDEDIDGSIRFRLTPEGVVQEIRLGPDLAEFLADGWEIVHPEDGIGFVEMGGYVRAFLAQKMANLLT